MSADYMFLSPKGIVLKSEVENRWEDPPEDCTRVLAGMCSASKVVFAFAVPQKGAELMGTRQRAYLRMYRGWATRGWLFVLITSRPLSN